MLAKLVRRRDSNRADNKQKASGVLVVELAGAV